MATVALNYAFFKTLSGEVLLIQAICLRSLMVAVMLFIPATKEGAFRLTLSKSDWGLMVFRVVGEGFGAALLLYAVFHMPLANVTAILQSMPFLIVIGAALFLREKVGWRRYVAVAMGFVGILIIVRPGMEGFTPVSLIALGSVFMFASRELATRKIQANVPPSITAFYTAAGMTFMSAILIPYTGWSEVSGWNWLMLLCASISVLFAYIFNIIAARTGEIAFVAPFRYSMLVWATIFGVIGFGEYPDFWTVIGGAFIVLTGLYVFYRERQLKLSK